MRSLLLATIAIALAGCAAPGPDGSAAAPDGPVVRMLNSVNDPATLTVPVGTSVTWINDDPYRHTVTPTDKALWGTEGSGDDEKDWMDEGARWSFTFERPGRYDYYCILHAGYYDGAWSGQLGAIIVE